MSDDTRRIAADARRIASSVGVKDDEKVVTNLRNALRRNYERGVAEGRRQVRRESRAIDPRELILGAFGDALENAATMMKTAPNSKRAQQALSEAGAVLRDARQRGEPPAAGEGKNG